MIQRADREAAIIHTSVVGIVVNILLVIFKAMVGFAAHSIAIILDAVNNLTDALSSIITIVGIHFANLAPDKSHPIGHGRLEYITTMVVSLIIIYAGVASLIESCRKIMHPEPPEYTIFTLIILVAAIVVKLLLGSYVRRESLRVACSALEASGLDALYDALISLSVLVSALIFISTGISLEAWVGLVISLIILKAGLGMLREGLDSVLGKRLDSELSLAIKDTITEFEEVMGAYDLVLNDYGPERYIGSVNIALDENLNTLDIDRLSHRIKEAVREEYNVVLNAVGVYAVNIGNDRADRMYHEIERLLMDHEHVIEIHGFYLNEEEHRIHFDVVLSFDTKDHNAMRQHIWTVVKCRYPSWDVSVNTEVDVSD